MTCSFVLIQYALVSNKSNERQRVCDKIAFEQRELYARRTRKILIDNVDDIFFL